MARDKDLCFAYTLPSVASSHVATLRTGSCKSGDLIKGPFESESIVRVAFEPLGPKAKAFLVRNAEAGPVTEFVFLVCLAFTDTGHMRFMQAEKNCCYRCVVA